MTLVNALRFYQRKKNTRVIACSAIFEAKGYLIASHANVILTQQSSPLYLPWSFVYESIYNAIGISKSDQELDESKLSDKIVVTHGDDTTLAGQFKRERPAEDNLAIYNKTTLEFFKQNVNTRKVQYSVFGVLRNLWKIYWQLGSGENILNMSYQVSHNHACSLNLIDQDKDKDYARYASSSLEQLQKKVVPGILH